MRTIYTMDGDSATATYSTSTSSSSSVFAPRRNRRVLTEREIADLTLIQRRLDVLALLRHKLDSVQQGLIRVLLHRIAILKFEAVPLDERFFMGLATSAVCQGCRGTRWVSWCTAKAPYTSGNLCLACHRKGWIESDGKYLSW